MSSKSDTYQTLKEPSKEVLFKEKGSKFYGYAFPVSSEQQIKEVLESIKKQHHTARHWCYAWQLGTEQKHYRANDDGEPNNSAGMPIYGQIQAFNVTQVLVVVVRYFGGVKLGVGGLITAYKTTAKMALEAATVITKTIKQQYELEFDYKHMSAVMRVVNENNAQIISQSLELNCKIVIGIRKQKAQQFENSLKNLYEVKLKKIAS